MNVSLRGKRFIDGSHTEQNMGKKCYMVSGVKAQRKANPSKGGQFGLSPPKRCVYALVPKCIENKYSGHFWANLGGLVSCSQF